MPMVVRITSSTRVLSNLASLRPFAPHTVYDYDIESKELTVRKVDKIPSGFDSADFHCERRFAIAKDGVKIPISVFSHKSVGTSDPAPLYLYGYGSYGYGLEPSFVRNWVVLARRGFRVAVAHIRGGDDCGREWYETGKLATKKNTFHDFIACAEHFVEAKLADPKQIVAAGGSAGGMLMGVVANERPDLFRLICAHVPFVDCVTTMLDDSLPLTAGEYNEWGNPNHKDDYFRIKEYSPYDNVKSQAYPAMYVTSGLNDPRVTYWEPTKWAQVLRSTVANGEEILLKMDLAAGHFSAADRYRDLRELAFDFAWLLDQLGKADE